MGTINKADQSIILVLNQYLERTTAQLPPERVLAARYRFSPSFETRMQPLFRKARKIDARWLRESQPQMKLRKRLVLIAIILAILASMAAVTIARQQIWDFIVTTYERYSKITFKDQRDPDPSYRLGAEDLKIPAGYDETERFATAEQLSIVYETQDGQLISFYRALNYSSPLVDTEGAVVKEITVRGQGGMCISKNGRNTIVWQEYYDIYILSGPLSKDELIAMLP